MKQLIFKPNLNKNKKYLVAVSGGSDSMALISALHESKFKLIVVHVNYQFRKSALDDQNLVINYCQKNKIKAFYKVRSEVVVGNLQSWAREYRYNFFKEIYEKEKCNALLTAHHQDDMIETYIMKKQRPAIYDSPAIQEYAVIKGMQVIRPLLNYKKEDLINYCSSKSVKFNHDETNFESKYQRNKIRNTIINNLTEKSREKYLKEIAFAQIKHEKINAKFLKEYNSIIKDNAISVAAFSKLDLDFKIKSLYKFIVAGSNLYPSLLSFRRLESFSKQIISTKPNLKIKLNDSFYLIKSYSSLTITNISNEQQFKYIVDKLAFKQFKEFKLSKQGLSLQGVHIYKADLPLTIRSYQSGDKVAIKNGHKQINRLFIDAKVAKNIRGSIPVVVNVKGEILLVSNYYVNPERKRLQNSVFVIKC
jgi:bifunctional protein TilS/HprT